MPPSLLEKPVGVLSARRHPLKVAGGKHLLDDGPALHPPHSPSAVSWPSSSSMSGFDLTEVRNGSEARSPSQVSGRIRRKCDGSLHAALALQPELLCARTGQSSRGMWRDGSLTSRTAGECLGDPGPGWAWLGEHGNYQSSGRPTAPTTSPVCGLCLTPCKDHRCFSSGHPDRLHIRPGLLHHLVCRDNSFVNGAEAGERLLGCSG